MISFVSIDLEKILNSILEWISTSGVRLVIGLVGLFVLFKIINAIAKRIKRRLEKKNADKTISVVSYHIIRKGLKIVVFVLFLGFIGIDTAAIGSVIGAAGIAIGLAIQGSLSNLAGGIVIILMRPFRIGDYIIAQGVEGTVEDIRIFHTILVTVDKKVIYLPNGVLANDKIVNTSQKDIRRVDNLFRISYQSDMKKAQEILLKLADEQGLVLKDPKATVEVSYAQTGLELSFRTYVKTENYWTVYNYFNKAVKDAFDSQNIAFSYNTLSVNLENEEK